VLTPRQAVEKIADAEAPKIRGDARVNKLAASLGWSDRVGTIETGKFADLVAVDGDPIANVRVLENVRFVTEGGEVIKSEQ
jgi:cytosine/adenosine deaminase-related metal-dependent hydrolase